MSVPKGASVDIPVDDKEGRFTHICASLFVIETGFDRLWCLSVYPLKIEKGNGYVCRTITGYSGYRKNVLPIEKRRTLKSFKTACKIAQSEYPLMIRDICAGYDIPCPDLSEYPDLSDYPDY